MDDGSADNTEELVQGFMTEKKLVIVYRKKENGGKHTALNAAISEIESELVFIVDSDDLLNEDAVALIYNFYDKYNHEIGLCGYSFIRVNSDGRYLHSGTLTKDVVIDTFVNLRINQNLSGDMAEVWYTKCLKEYPFPEFRGEKFIGEDVVWIRMSGKYKLVFTNKVIYICEYLGDGLTKNRRQYNITSPKGCVLRAKTFLEADIKLKYLIKPGVQYIVYGLFANYKLNKMFKECPLKLLFIALFLPSCLIYFFLKRGTHNNHA
jgi:hypothetical protein